MWSILLAIFNIAFYSALLIWGGYTWGEGNTGAGFWVLYGIVWAIYILLAIIGFVIRVVVAATGTINNHGGESSASPNYAWGRRRRAR